MKHVSSAGFADKVTRKELFHITIKKKHLYNIVWKCYLFTFVSVVKEACLPPLGKKGKGIRTTCKIKKIRENEHVLHEAI
jgi:hypothetical protein